ncbi:lipopolysaccharide biosynthesis protein [Segatella paludivivens]|uniref:lipopolysaccharide biosynthesis protein n=1 Tax=Segatella paludivivens TaxID=185294 RepID=UPI00037DD178|nr:lipopolysaccharide biosynthesis protein [Segatella paludivivens]
MSKISKGFFWSAVDYFSVQGISFIISIIIARLVSPSAYGVVVMVQVFMAFAQLFIDGGFKGALIHKKDRTDKDYYTVFIFNMVIAVILYLVIFISSPYIADFYHAPELKNLTRVIALNLIFSSLSITQLIKLQAVLDFKTQAKARTTSVIISGVIGVYCAYKGMEAWALVIQSVSSTLLSSIMLMSFSHWMPRFIFSIKSFRNLFGFGSKLLFTDFLTTCYIQITNLVIGKIYSPAQLAYYNKGFTISMLPSASIMEVLGRTIYPIYCGLQNNKDKLDIAYRKYLRLSCMAIFPILILICVLSKPLIIILLTKKWVEAAPLLSIFCISFITYPYLYNCGNYSVALGYAGLNAKASVIKRIFSFVLIIIALNINITAIALSIVISNIIEMYISLRVARTSGGITISKQLGFTKDLLGISILTALAIYLVLLIFDNYYLQFIIGGFVGLVVFIGSLFIFRIEENEYLKLELCKFYDRFFCRKHII